jgi:hypothetical protein
MKYAIKLNKKFINLYDFWDKYKKSWLKNYWWYNTL